jgi:hypothetical protein
MGMGRVADVEAADVKMGEATDDGDEARTSPTPKQTR